MGHLENAARLTKPVTGSTRRLPRIAHIAENTVPQSEAQVRSGEPVAAVLEILGGKAAELGISPGDKVSWR